MNSRKKSLETTARARKRIPGLSQLLSKKPDMFAPDQWPGYYSRAQGVQTWDLDGNLYTDMSINGIGACVLGFADPTVNEAVKKVIDDGNMCTLNSAEEVELAELLCDLHPWAAKVRYPRSGGEAMAAAVRIARAHTQRDKILFCGYHGWHDWYLAANLGSEKSLDGHLLPGLEPSGVPRGLRGTALPFEYNDIVTLEKLLNENRSEVAAIVMEPIRDRPPNPGFLERIRELADQNKAVLVFDEITAGFRLTTGGSHLLFGVNPDIAVFSKAISNGYPMAVVLGRADVMDACENSFISSTYWTDRIGPVAALATIRKFRDKKVAGHLEIMGKKIQEGWKTLGHKHDLHVHTHGVYPLSHFGFEYPNGLALMTLFVQLMLEKGFLASGRFYPTFAHTDAHCDAYLKSVDEAFGHIAHARKTDSVEKLLKGPVAQSGFKRLT